MFKSKYKVTLIDSKWNVVKNNVKLSVLPRRDEYVFFDGLYYLVLNVVHVLDGKQGVFVIINETPYQLKQA
jgi:hypothetical protein